MQVDRATQEAVDFFGGSISCLINNAGIADPNLNGNKAQRLASWDKFIATNLSGELRPVPHLYLVCVATIP